MDRRPEHGVEEGVQPELHTRIGNRLAVAAGLGSKENHYYNKADDDDEPTDQRLKIPVERGVRFV